MDFLYLKLRLWARINMLFQFKDFYICVEIFVSVWAAVFSLEVFLVGCVLEVKKKRCGTEYLILFLWKLYQKEGSLYR